MRPCALVHRTTRLRVGRMHRVAHKRFSLEGRATVTRKYGCLCKLSLSFVFPFVLFPSLLPSASLSVSCSLHLFSSFYLFWFYSLFSSRLPRCLSMVHTLCIRTLYVLLVHSRNAIFSIIYSNKFYPLIVPYILRYLTRYYSQTLRNLTLF